ncbi:MAG: hypothetical protein ACOCP4_02930 [Candidatus Woesearchaeota archaeon]
MSKVDTIDDRFIKKNNYILKRIKELGKYNTYVKLFDRIYDDISKNIEIIREEVKKELITQKQITDKIRSERHDYMTEKNELISGIEQDNKDKEELFKNILSVVDDNNAEFVKKEIEKYKEKRNKNFHFNFVNLNLKIERRNEFYKKMFKENGKNK